MHLLDHFKFHFIYHDHDDDQVGLERKTRAFDVTSAPNMTIITVFTIMHGITPLLL